MRKFTANEWYTFSLARCTHLIILVVANDCILFNKCSKMLYFWKNHILSNLFVKPKQYKPSSWRHFVSATSFWFLLPLMTLVAPNHMIAPYKTKDTLVYFDHTLKVLHVWLPIKLGFWEVRDYWWRRQPVAIFVWDFRGRLEHRKRGTVQRKK